MTELRAPILGVALAAALTSTAGFCAFQQTTGAPASPVFTMPPPARTLPPAVLPYPLSDPAPVPDVQ